MDKMDLRKLLDTKIQRVFKNKADEKADPKGNGIYFDQYLKQIFVNINKEICSDKLSTRDRVRLIVDDLFKKPVPKIVKKESVDAFKGLSRWHMACQTNHVETVDGWTNTVKERKMHILDKTIEDEFNKTVEMFDLYVDVMETGVNKSL